MRLAAYVWICSLFSLAGMCQEGVAAPARPPQVQLDNGVIGRLGWRIVAWHDGRGGARRTCTGIQLHELESSEASLSAGCSGIPPRAPLLHSVTRDMGKRPATVFTFAAAATVMKVTLDFGPRGIRRIMPQMLNQAKARKAGLTPIRYASFAFNGALCFRGFTEYDHLGHVIVTTGKTPCQ